MRSLSLLLAVGAVMAVSLVSCGEGSEPPSSSVNKKAEEEKKEKAEKEKREKAEKEKKEKAEKEKKEKASVVGDYLGYRQVFTLSTECYSFAPDGQVELRHSGLPQVNERGEYRNGKIFWENDQIIPATVSGAGQKIRINGVDFTKIQSCLNIPR